MSTTPNLAGAAVGDPSAFLAGRPPMGEFLGFVAYKSVEGPTLDRGDLAQTWRDANTRVRELEQAEPNIANEIEVTSVPPTCLSFAQRVLVDPMVKAAFNLTPTEIAMVELDKLVVFQKLINLAHVARLQKILGDESSIEKALRFALPIDERFDPPVQVMQTAQNEWVFQSPSNDFRLLDAMLVPPNGGLPVVGGTPTRMIALAIGYGSNLLNAVRIDGRLILNNGSHRAYALREAGFKHAPCLIQNLTSREELKVVVAGDVGENAAAYLDTPRPPLLKDYFDEQLRIVYHVPRTLHQVRVQYGCQPADVPAVMPGAGG
jgi:hypothetical protein